MKIPHTKVLQENFACSSELFFWILDFSFRGRHIFTCDTIFHTLVYTWMLNIPLAPLSFNVNKEALCNFSCFRDDRWSFPPDGPRGGDASSPSRNWIPPTETHSALCPICVVPSRQGFLPCLPSEARQEGSSYERLYLLARGITHKAEIFIWFEFFVFKQVALPRTSSAKAGSEILISGWFFFFFSQLQKKNRWTHDFKRAECRFTTLPEKWWKTMVLTGYQIIKGGNFC